MDEQKKLLMIAIAIGGLTSTAAYFAGASAGGRSRDLEMIEAWEAVGDCSTAAMWTAMVVRRVSDRLVNGLSQSKMMLDSLEEHEVNVLYAIGVGDILDATGDGELESAVESLRDVTSRAVGAIEVLAMELSNRGLLPQDIEDELIPDTDGLRTVAAVANDLSLKCPSRAALADARRLRERGRD